VDSNKIFFISSVVRMSLAISHIFSNASSSPLFDTKCQAVFH
jgi:hypothetical protein